MRVGLDWAGLFYVSHDLRVKATKSHAAAGSAGLVLAVDASTAFGAGAMEVNEDGCRLHLAWIVKGLWMGLVICFAEYVVAWLLVAELWRGKWG
jgi:hypothetical protein